MIGYLVVEEINGKHIGGIMVTNELGIPQEFKYTDPIVPTALQKIIYGNSLEFYLHTEIIAKSLVQKLENKPEVIFVDETKLLFDKSIVFISLLPQTVQEKKEGNEAIINLEGKTVRVMLTENSVIDDRLIDKIRELGTQMDIFEPLSRVRKALEYVCES